jgi:hypothetical protein
MRIFFFLLLTNVSFGQVWSSRTQPIIPGPIDSLIVGEWYLKETITSARYESDTMPKIREKETNNSHIKITKDSIVIPHNERYYKRYEGYNYELDGNLMKLYFGLKKKRKQVDSLTIELLDFEEMVLSSEEYVESPLGFNVIKVNYRYQRSPSAAYDSLVSILSGKWETASDEQIPFLWNDSLAEIRLFKNSPPNDSLNHHLDLTFERKSYGICMYYLYSYSSKSLFNIEDGVYIGEQPMQIDRTKQLLYFIGREIVVYQYTFNGLNELILKYVKTIKQE